MDTALALATSERMWHDSIVPTLMDYITIPNMSPQFDPKWIKNGHMNNAVNLLTLWAEEQELPGLKISRHQIDKRTPIILMEIPPVGPYTGTVLLYGHLDKQPECGEWTDGLSPWQPSLRGDRLYGRGGADDGYAMFASLTAVLLLHEQGLPHGRIVILIEASEESGSPDLPAYVDKFADVIGTPELVICLDSGCADYERLWMTTSLRGLVSGDLKVKILTEGVHSGAASGIVPDSFRLICNTISTIEDQLGRIKIPELNVAIPPDREAQASEAAKILGTSVYEDYPWVPSAKGHARDDLQTLLLRKTWRPALTVVGADGFPPEAGNTLRPFTTFRLSMRIPPTVNADVAAAALKRDLEKNPQYGAEVTFDVFKSASGWNAPSFAPWLEKSISDASVACFGKPSIAYGEGGTIPFMGMLGAKFPDAQFLITGVLGPGSNAHGPNEFLHIPMGIKLTVAVAKVITDHATQSNN